LKIFDNSLFLKVDRSRVNAISNSSRTRSIIKHMSQMCLTFLAHSFYPSHSMTIIHILLNSWCYTLTESRPSTSWVEFHFRFKQSSSTYYAIVNSFFKMLIIFISIRRFCPCFLCDSSLQRSQVRNVELSCFVHLTSSTAYCFY